MANDPLEKAQVPPFENHWIIERVINSFSHQLIVSSVYTNSNGKHYVGKVFFVIFFKLI